METLNFDYRPRMRSGVLLMLFGIIFGAGMLWMAVENDKGLDVFGFVLPVAVATVFYVVMGVFFALGVPIGLRLIRDSRGEPAQVILAAATITAPTSPLIKKTRVIPYRDITGVRIQKIQRNTFLLISSDQKTLSIPKMAVSRPGDFDRLHQAIEKRVAAGGVRL